MNENKTTTYGDLRRRKAEIRIKAMESGEFSKEESDEYQEILRLIKQAEMWLLWTIVSLMLTIAGCHTVNGVGQDLSAWSSPYIYQER